MNMPGKLELASCILLEYYWTGTVQHTASTSRFCKPSVTCTLFDVNIQPDNRMSKRHCAGGVAATTLFALHYLSCSLSTWATQLIAAGKRVNIPWQGEVCLCWQAGHTCGAALVLHCSKAKLNQRFGCRFAGLYFDSRCVHCHTQPVADVEQRWLLPGKHAHLISDDLPCCAILFSPPCNSHLFEHDC